MTEIQSLLERYYNAETTVAEEVLIREYLKDHPEAADPASVLLCKDVALLAAGPEPVKQKRPRCHLWWATVPAAAAVLLVLWLSRPVTLPGHSGLTASLLTEEAVSGEIQDEVLALEQARKALNYVSATLNKGSRQIGQLEKLETAVDKIKNESL